MNVATYLSRRWHALCQARQPWDRAWQEVAAHFLPTRRRLHDGRQPPLLNGNLVDATGVLALRTLAAGLYGGMTSPARPWFRLECTDMDLGRDPDARRWLDAVTARMRVALHRSNFYNALHTLYAELGAFGTAFMFALGDVEHGIRFVPLHIGEYALDVDDMGRVDTVFRRVRLSARQLLQAFGPHALPGTIRRAATHPGPEATGGTNGAYTVIHAVLPRQELPRIPGASEASGGMTGDVGDEEGCIARSPYASIYWLEGVSGNGGSGGIHILRVSGFHSFPGFAPRWDCLNNDVYGRSPAMDALPDCRMLQQMGITTLKAIHKAVDPPMSVSAGLKSVGIDLTPGGINYVESAPGQSPQAATPLLNLSPDIGQARKAIESVQEQVRAGMYNDLFRLIMDGRSGVTASEVAAREEEKLILVGPVLERLHDELFRPLIERVFALMRRLDMLPATPPVLRGHPLRVDFVSLLAQAQKLVATAAVDTYLGFGARAAACWPEALDAVDIDGAMEAYAEYLGLDAGLVRTPDARAQLRAERAQRQAVAQGQAGITQLAQVAKTLSETRLSPDNALGALGALGGEAVQGMAQTTDKHP